MADSQTTRPLTDEDWIYWQKLVSDELERQAAKIERLRKPQTTKLDAFYVWQARAYWVFSGATIAAFVSIGAYVLAVLYGIICTTLALASEGMAHD